MTRAFLLHHPVDDFQQLVRRRNSSLGFAVGRDAFDSLVKAWTAEQGASSYAKSSSALEGMLPEAAVDNRKTIEDLQNQLRELRSHVQKNQSDLARSNHEARTKRHTQIKRTTGSNSDACTKDLTRRPSIGI
jgi:hypothetical protein